MTTNKNKDGFTIIPDDLLARKDLTMLDKVLYARLIRYAGKKDQAFPKQTTLAANLGTTQRAISEALKRLEQAKMIQYITGGRCYRYRILARAGVPVEGAVTAVASEIPIPIDSPADLSESAVKGSAGDSLVRTTDISANTAHVSDSAGGVSDPVSMVSDSADHQTETDDKLSDSAPGVSVSVYKNSHLQAGLATNGSENESVAANVRVQVNAKKQRNTSTEEDALTIQNQEHTLNIDLELKCEGEQKTVECLPQTEPQDASDEVGAVFDKSRISDSDKGPRLREPQRIEPTREYSRRWSTAGCDVERKIQWIRGEFDLDALRKGWPNLFWDGWTCRPEAEKYAQRAIALEDAATTAS